MAKDYYFDVRDPRNPENATVKSKLPGPLYQKHYKSNFVKYMNLKAAKEVIEDTKLIFAGVREFQEGGWCYVGKPSMHYIRDTITVPIPPGHVFTVYMNPVMMIYEWRLEITEGAGSLLPLGHKARYERLAWQSTS